MPVYVYRFNNNDGGPIKVEYTSAPLWKFQHREIANRECEFLRNQRVYVGTHFCDFAVVDLEGGEFAIACEYHPPELRHAAEDQK